MNQPRSFIAHCLRALPRSVMPGAHCGKDGPAFATVNSPAVLMVSRWASCAQSGGERAAAELPGWRQPSAQLFYTTKADPRRENQPDITRLETASGLRDWIMSLRGFGAAQTRGHWHKSSSIVRTHLFVTHCVPVLCLVHHTQCYISEGPFKFGIYSHCSQTK